MLVVVVVVIFEHSRVVIFVMCAEVVPKVVVDHRTLGLNI
jgi:hypothetical protein